MISSSTKGIAHMHSATDPAKDSRPPAVFKRDLIGLLLLSPILLTGCLTSRFLAFDDLYHVSTPAVRCMQPWWQCFFPDVTETFFPLATLTYRLEYYVLEFCLGILNWAPFARVDNLIIHAIGAICIFAFLKSFSFSRPARVFVTGAFLIHPMACESVCWVSERKNVLTAAFGFGAIALMACYRQHWWRLLAASFLYILALCSKPAALGLMPVLAGLEVLLLWQRRNSDGLDAVKKDLRGTAAGAAVILAATLAALALNLHGDAPLLLAPPGGSVYTGLLTDAEILRLYMQHLIMPVDISFFYCVKPIVSALEPRFILNMSLVLGMVALTIWLSKRRDLSLFLWIWFFGALGPVMNIIAFSFVMQDRFVYLSSPAFFAALSLAAEGLLERLRKPAPEQPPRVSANFGLAAVWVIVLLYAGGAGVRSYVFDNTLVLFADAAQKQPESVFAQSHYGIALAKAADWQEAHAKGESDKEMALSFRNQAAEHLDIACHLPDFDRLIDPGHPWWMLAYVQRRLGHLKEAEANARTATANHFHTPVEPHTLADAHVGLGEILLEQNRPEEARVEADVAIQMADTYPSAWVLKGRVLEALKLPKEAADAYDKVKRGTSYYDVAQARLRELRK